MRTTSSRGAVALLLAAAGAAAIGSAPAAAAEDRGGARIALRRCAPRDGSDRTRCGTVAVPLDRSGAVPGAVRLRVRVVPSRTRRASGTVIALAGGPGQAATPLAPAMAEILGAVARSRRVVTFDQRGTGRSGRLACAALDRARTNRAITAAVGDCARRIGPRRVAYTSSASVDDIEAVRAALGVERVALYAVSYGTKVAVSYAARYPHRVSRLVLDSVVPPEGSDPFMRSTIVSMRRVLRAICKGGACRFTRDPAADLHAVGRRLARGPIRGVRYDGRGRGRRVSVTQARLFSLLLAGDFDPLTRAALPAALSAAARGDAAPLARLVGQPSGEAGLDDRHDSHALFIATTCEDGGVPWPTGTPVEQRPGAFARELAAVPAAELAPFGHATLRALGIDYCRTWPESPIEQPPVAPLPDVPALLLAGEEDVRTPREDAAALAARLPRATLVTVPHTGHSVLGAETGRCAGRALRRFFGGGRVRDCRSGGRRLLDVVRPLPSRFGALRPASGTPGRAGRTVTAVAATFGAIASDLMSEIYARLLAGDFGVLSGEPVRSGGLRGGSVELNGKGFVLRRYSAVPGVTISGTIRVDLDRGALRVGGRSAARGTLRFGPRAVTGRLGGRAVRIPVGALGSATLSSAVAAPAIPAPSALAAAARERARALAPDGAPTLPAASFPGLPTAPEPAAVDR
ncbi:alpha/beta hydrolase [Conexibacter arvalis]|uniref:Pimeloyl-ACP methyl ester carboxylesterase n=1 Tax=Conexibacter arvalis TaxID=912552 RepID=A0A840IH61_9ACTN|nr:alpha/beta fold hydrolase [Conexibacter arvalis]MBB4663290.1 pimeloyl-ACP methyl ester carboxylesterase [Conexibacter arvalis]